MDSALDSPTQVNQATPRFRLSRSTIQKILIYTLLFVGAFVSLVPFVWMISTSFKSLGEAISVRFFPSQLLWENYVEAWERAVFSKYFFNSVKITLISLIGSISLSTVAAYAFARIKFPGRDLIFGVLLATIMIPEMVTIIPNFLTVTWLGSHRADCVDQQLACAHCSVYGQRLQHLSTQAVFRPDSR